LGLIEDLFRGTSGSAVTLLFAEVAGRAIFGTSILQTGLSLIRGEPVVAGRGIFERAFDFGQDVRASFASDEDAVSGVRQLVETDIATTGEVQTILLFNDIVNAARQQWSSVQVLFTESAANDQAVRSLNSGRDDTDIIPANTRDRGIIYMVVSGRR